MPRLPRIRRSRRRPKRLKRPRRPKARPMLLLLPQKPLKRQMRRRLRLKSSPRQRLPRPQPSMELPQHHHTHHLGPPLLDYHRNPPRPRLPNRQSAPLLVQVLFAAMLPPPSIYSLLHLPGTMHSLQPSPPLNPLPISMPSTTTHPSSRQTPRYSKELNLASSVTIEISSCNS